MRLIIFLFPITLLAQAPVLVDGPVVGNITRSGAVVAWTTDIASSTTYVKWGLSAGTMTNKITQQTLRYIEQSAPIGGTPASTTITYSPCSTSIAGEVQLTITTAGVGYNHIPTLTLSGGGGSGYAAADVSGGALTHAFAVVSSPYSSNPTVTITPTGGDTPSVTAVVTATVITVATEACYGPYTYMSAAAGSTIPADPLTPTPVDTPTYPTGTIRTVGSTSHDCNDATDGLVAQWAASSCGDIVEIDPTITPYCASADLYTYPAKSCTNTNLILTRVKNAQTLFASKRGVTINGQPWQAGVTPSDEPNMGRIIYNSPNFNWTTSAPSGLCYAGSFYWYGGQNPTWPLYYCGNTNPKSISSVPSSGTLIVTVTAHGYTNGLSGHVSGCSGAGAATLNDDWLLQVVDANTIQLNPIYFGQSNTSTGNATGCTIYENTLTQPTYTAVPSTGPTSCTLGTWYHYDTAGATDEFHRTWYGSRNPSSGVCEIVPVRFSDYQNQQPPSSIDLVTNSPTGIMFQGISMEPLYLKGDPQTVQYIPADGDGNGGVKSGNTFVTFLNPGPYSNHLYLQNMLIGCNDPDVTVTSVRCWVGVGINGSNLSVSDSWLYGFQLYGSVSSQVDEDTEAMYGSGVKSLNVSGTYLGGAGFGLYLDGSGNTMNAYQDLTIMGNYFDRSDKYWNSVLNTSFNTLTSQNMAFSTRHNLELKAAQRASITNNIFYGGWQYDNSADAICLCSRSNPEQSQPNGANITMYPAQGNIGYSGYYASSIVPGDLIGFSQGSGSCNGVSMSNLASTAPYHLFTVNAVTDSLHFTLNQSTNCTSGSNVQIAHLNSSTGILTDILVQGNSFINNPEGIDFIANDSYGGIPYIVQGPGQRFRIANNTFSSIDVLRIGAGSQWYSIPIGDGVQPTGGSIIHDSSGVLEDLQILNNFDANRVSTSNWQTFFLALAYNNGGYRSGIGSGLTISGNTTTYVNQTTLNCGEVLNDSNVYQGTAMLNADWAGTSPLWNWSSNTVYRTGGGTGSPCDPSTAPWGPYPAGTIWVSPGSLSTFYGVISLGASSH